LKKEDIVKGIDCRRERDNLTAASAAYLNLALELTAHSVGFLSTSEFVSCGLQLTGSVRFLSHVNVVCLKTGASSKQNKGLYGRVHIDATPLP
jgi:hypothetical protein